MGVKTKFKRSAICVGVRFVRTARAGSFSSLHNAVFFCFCLIFSFLDLLFFDLDTLSERERQRFQ